VIQAFLDAIIDELAAGNRLEFREFGVFESKERAARRAQNPRTLEKVQVPAKRIVKFKVGRMMRKKVSGDDVGDEPFDDDDDDSDADDDEDDDVEASDDDSDDDLDDADDPEGTDRSY
ncbi:MAG TPA: HU family DNA-binding protein, partial [Microbacteriaceae bacterium]|nr:HU family DNA-binding protein [Microbacteriaceae bacterium]